MIRCITNRFGWDLKNVEFDNLAAFEMYLMWRHAMPSEDLIEGEDWELV